MTSTLLDLLNPSWLTSQSAGSILADILAGLLTLSCLLSLLLLRVIYGLRYRLTKAEGSSRDRETSYQSLLNAIPFPVMQKNAAGAYLRLNEACRIRLGIEPFQMIGRTSLDLHDHRLQDMTDGVSVERKIHQLSMDVICNSQTQHCEIDYKSLDGRQRNGLLIESPVRLGGESSIGSVGVLLDITQYREIELSTLATERSLREITQRMPVVVFVVQRDSDRLSRLAFIAGNLGALFGLSPTDLVEKSDILRDWPFHDRIHTEDTTALQHLIHRASRHTGTTTFDFRAYGAEGLRWIHLVMVARRLPNRGMQWVGYFIDTTSINAHNEALRSARDAAERASKAKASFLAMMSHEIRTPMNGVLGMIELLEHTPVNTEQHELLYAVKDSASVLMQVLNDVLDFSKLEAGNLHLDSAPFDPRTLIDNVVGVMANSLHKKGLRIEVNADSVLAGRLLGDSVRIRQILLNLLSNAIKFTERGSIFVGIRVLGDDGQSQRVCLIVADTGIGIADDKQTNLFTPFSQAESWTTRRYGGTGLGLSICRHLVQLMGGTIEMNSSLGQGTTFTIELRLPIARRGIDRHPTLVNRHAIVRLSSIGIAGGLTAHLKALGLTVEQIPPSQPLRSGIAADLLFVATSDKEIRTRTATKVIEVDTQPYVFRGLQEGDDRIVLSVNPLKWQAVLRTCLLALGRESPHFDEEEQVVLATRSDTIVRARSRILVAEDHPISQSLIRRQLTLLGWSCDVVGDGKLAYDALCHGGYGILLTDCQMPQMSGYQLASEWRGHEAKNALQARIPIIAMTANVLDGEIERCLAAGMDDYLSKPVQLQELDRKLKAWMNGSLTIDRASSEPSTPSQENGSTSADLQSLQADMLKLLLQTGSSDIAKIDLAFINADAIQAMQAIHHLVGVLELFTSDRVIEDGRSLMRDLVESDKAGALRKLPAYAKDLRQTLAKLEARAVSV
ncbi:ATP-binding protein [Dyella japonica]|uniref:histidine kinase n=1 Tax=Dyella japonica A8 TaxID=1217721 RepID=A0A075JW61_9GAMM|nr:ATP-binding protein [Dyella japonica]AIF46109.1 histidine kinase [Dyella japonica A8]